MSSSFKPSSFSGSYQRERERLSSSASRRSHHELPIGRLGEGSSKDKTTENGDKQDYALGKRDAVATSGGKPSGLTAGLNSQPLEPEPSSGGGNSSKASSKDRQSVNKEREGTKTPESTKISGQGGKDSHLQVPPSQRSVSPSTGTQTPPLTPMRTPNKTATDVAPPSQGGGGNSSAITPTDVEEVPTEEKLRILRRHLVSAEERQAGEEARRSSTIEAPSADTLKALRPDTVSTSRKSSNTMGSHRPDSSRAGGEQASVFLDDDESSDPVTNRGNETSKSRKGSMLRRPGSETPDTFPIPYDAVGADVTHGIYKYQQTHAADATVHKRSLSFSGVRRGSGELDESLQRLHEPGGMRRHYVIHRAVASGQDKPVVLRSFIDFLFLYGHFVSLSLRSTTLDTTAHQIYDVPLQAGEDLDEDEDFEDLDEEAHAGVVPPSVLRQRHGPRDEDADERSPLLRSKTGSRGRSVTRLKRGASVGKTGDATVSQAVLMVSCQSSVAIKSPSSDRVRSLGSS